MPKLVIYMTNDMMVFRELKDRLYIVDAGLFPFVTEEYGKIWAKTFPTDIVMWVEE